jgi:hypothetical protein
MYITYKYSVRTSQRTHCASFRKTNPGMLCREIVAVYCKNYTKDKITIQPGYNNIGLRDTSSITSDVPWYQLIPHC